jgi:effector-binding domain-containing protein
MKTLFTVLAVIVVIVLAGSPALTGAPVPEGQGAPAGDALKTPRIVTLPDQKMLVVEAKGDPNTAGGTAFGLLFKTFFSLPGVRMAPPRARWTSPGGLGMDAKSEWTGYYALPLPESVTGLPAGLQGVKIEIWPYGEVAEILHVGPYAEETPTIEKLHKFIAEKGYAIAGLHEEEYVVGPGMGPTDPATYRTIIRYQIKKK